MDWYQEALFDAHEVFEFTLKIGVIPSANHVQWWMETKDPMTGVLISAASNPHGTFARMTYLLEEALRRLAQEVENRLQPF